MKKSRDSFTLIEMLVVISVIAILAGLSFKLVQISKRNADRAATVAKLEKVAHALNEFKSEYGMYPPVAANVCKEHNGWDCRVCYQYEDTNSQSSFVVGKIEETPESAKDLFQMGLVSFLEKRDKPGIYHTERNDWVPDTERDELAKERWSVFLDGVVGDGVASNNLLGASSEAGYNSPLRTIKDSWDQVIRYESDPPYLSYRLWSKGPDKADGTVDDIHKDRWDN